MANIEIFNSKSFENQAAGIMDHVEQEYQDETDDEEVSADNSIAQTLTELIDQNS